VPFNTTNVFVVFVVAKLMRKVTKAYACDYFFYMYVYTST